MKTLILQAIMRRMQHRKGAVFPHIQSQKTPAASRIGDDRYENGKTKWHRAKTADTMAMPCIRISKTLQRCKEREGTFRSTYAIAPAHETRRASRRASEFDKCDCEFWAQTRQEGG